MSEHKPEWVDKVRTTAKKVASEAKHLAGDAVRELERLADEATPQVEKVLDKLEPQLGDARKHVEKAARDLGVVVDEIVQGVREGLAKEPPAAAQDAEGGDGGAPAEPEDR